MENYSLPRRIWRILYPPLIFIAISILVGVIAGFAGGLYIGIREAAGGAAVIDQARLAEELQQILLDNAMLIQLIVGLAGFAVFMPIWLRTRKKTARYKNNSLAVTGIISTGLFFAFCLTFVCIISFVDLLRFFPSYAEVNDIFSSSTLVWRIIALGIAAPVVEELCFRGILINRMHWMPVWVAVVLQGILFGLVHFNLFQGLYAFVIGLMLGLVYVKFRSIILVIVCHSAFNLASILLSTLISEESIILVLIPSAIVTAVCTILLFKRPCAEIIPESAPADTDLYPEL